MESKNLAKFLAQEGQLLLPMLDLILKTESAIDKVIDVAGRAAIEAILLLSANQVAGERHPDKKAARFIVTARRPGSCRSRTANSE